MNDTPVLRLDLPLVLPDAPDARDRCVARLTETLAARAGVRGAHVVAASGERPAQLCIHYDPRALTLARVRELTLAAGAQRSRSALRTPPRTWPRFCTHARRARSRSSSRA